VALALSAAKVSVVLFLLLLCLTFPETVVTVQTSAMNSKLKILENIYIDILCNTVNDKSYVGEVLAFIGFYHNVGKTFIVLL